LNGNPGIKKPLGRFKDRLEDTKWILNKQKGEV
jgi:hypothetical protein